MSDGQECDGCVLWLVEILSVSVEKDNKGTDQINMHQLRYLMKWGL